MNERKKDREKGRGMYRERRERETKGEIKRER